MPFSVSKLVMYLWLTTILLLVFLSIAKHLLGVEHMFGGEILWLFIAPGIVGWVYRKKQGQSVPQDIANKAANGFVASVMLVSLTALVAYYSDSWSPHMTERWISVVIAIVFYCAFLWFVGRWAVSMGLNNYGRHGKRE